MSTFNAPANPAGPALTNPAQPTGFANAAGITGAARLAEKTIELTVCGQLSANLIQQAPGANVVWIGLTQTQERQFGFDAATDLNGSALLLQFKASCQVLPTGRRRFTVEHNQMQRLCDHFRNHNRTVFYVFPNVGTVPELTTVNGDILGSSWLVDVADLPDPLPLPTVANGTSVRKNNCHYADLDVNGPHPTCYFHSTPFQAPLISPKSLWATGIPGVSTSQLIDELKRFAARSDAVTEAFFRNAVVGVRL